MNEALLDTWRIHNRINLYLLDGLEEQSLKDVSASKGRIVGEQRIASPRSDCVGIEAIRSPCR